MAPINRSCSDATLQANMYIEKFNIYWLSLCIKEQRCRVLGKTYLMTTCSEGCPPKRGYILIFVAAENGTSRQIQLKRNFPELVPHRKVQYFLI
jgi:hypothetical protein